MTVVIAVKDDEGKLVFGADSAASCDTSLSIRPDVKVFKKKGYTIGFAGSFRLFQIVRYEMVLPDIPPHLSSASALKFMVQKFVGRLRRYHAEQGVMKTSSGVDGFDGSTLLVGFQSHIFTVEDDYHVAPHAEYAAIGCGSEAALGSLYALKESGAMSAVDAVRTALNAAEYSCTSVRGPMHVIT